MFNNKVISIDIGSKNIKIAEGKHVKNDVHISNAVILQTPKESFYDGKILDKHKIKEVILDTIKRKKMKAKKVVFTIQSTSVVTREMYLPDVKKEELDSIVRFEVEQYLPILLNDYVIQYKTLDKKSDNEKIKLQVIALPKDIVKMYLELAKELKLKPLALDINSNAISKLFSKGIKINDEKYSFDKTVALIDLGYDKLDVNIIKGGCSHFSRIIPKGGKDIDITIANSFNLELNEAEEKKVNEVNLDETNNNLSSGMLNEVTKRIIEEWTSEVSRVFQYYMSRNREFRVDKIYLYGGSSQIQNINNIISNQLNMPVSIIKNMSNIKIGKTIDDIEIERFLNAVGAIIRR
ncbi:type IV pilus assembly protein PilM [Thermohalobacter berrensis]|uniref:SHS2 domain-containing protein n=1 Tax=Thermohalobacter berrensis TaxID=99594 RepID=A0A419TAU1_9FIRM|nr:type IV pilus assembly protein PilM [Thermohalobacter berrensis]RKD34590.1 hypothetical protein BET03_01825 [Thermohalobacter berrensis]